MGIPHGPSATGSLAGTAFAMAQTPTAISGSPRNLACFVPMAFVSSRWQPPAGQQLPERPYALLVTRDGTLWIGTFAGLASWNNGKLTQYPEVGAGFITSLLEDREGTVWAGAMGGSRGDPYRAAVRHSKRQRTMLRTRWRLRQFRLEFG